MAGAPQERHQEGLQLPRDGGIRWVISPEALDGLPTQSLWHNRAVVADVGDQQSIGVGIYAIPPRETGLSKFWSAITRSRSETPQAVRLRIEPPVPMTDYRKGDHTRLSAMHPYAVLEDDTRYGVGVWIPRSLFGEWSEPQERDAGGYFGDKEVYQQRRMPAILVRLDGETPLGERVLPGGTRQEVLLGVPEPTDDSTGDVFVLVTNRQVSGVRGREDRADVSDLSFNVIAERGTDANAVIDDKGLVQVVVTQVTEDHVTERIPGNKMMGLLGDPYQEQMRGALSFGDSPMRGATKGLDSTLTGVGATLRGETRFTGTRREKVSITNITGVEPVAELKLALVGNGGSITAEMTEAQMPQQS